MSISNLNNVLEGLTFNLKASSYLCRAFRLVCVCVLITCEWQVLLGAIKGSFHFESLLNKEQIYDPLQLTRPFSPRPVNP